MPDEIMPIEVIKGTMISSKPWDVLAYGSKAILNFGPYRTKKDAVAKYEQLLRDYPNLVKPKTPQ